MGRRLAAKEIAQADEGENNGSHGFWKVEGRLGARYGQNGGWRQSWQWTAPTVLVRWSVVFWASEHERHRR